MESPIKDKLDELSGSGIKLKRPTNFWPPYKLIKRFEFHTFCNSDSTMTLAGPLVSLDGLARKDILLLA